VPTKHPKDTKVGKKEVAGELCEWDVSDGGVRKMGSGKWERRRR